MQLGITVKLLTYLTKQCPKYGQTRLPPFKNFDGVIYFDAADLSGYKKYLSEPRNHEFTVLLIKIG
jgi:hypothetical protein